MTKPAVRRQPGPKAGVRSFAAGEFKDNEARQAYMSACLKGGGAPMTQQEKMTACNKQAADKAMKGDDRKAFMSKCLSN
jgi:hypothetical protein